MTNLTLVTEALSKAVADTYAAALLAQTYHWNVKGPSFYGHHKLFEELYDDAFGAIDGLAERMLALGSDAPGGFAALGALATVPSPRSGISADAMIDDLIGAQEQTVRVLKAACDAAEAASDGVTAGMLEDRIEAHEKQAWMLRSVRA